MATNVLQAMATNAAVDSPVVLPSDSIMKTGLQCPVSVSLYFKFQTCNAEPLSPLSVRVNSSYPEVATAL